MSEIASYIQSLDLPAAPTRGAADRGPPPAFTAARQAVTVGSQMAEFSSAVPQAVRPVVSNGLLLGQLAADKAAAANADPAAYFGAFNSVMKKSDGRSPRTNSPSRPFPTRTPSCIRRSFLSSPRSSAPAPRRTRSSSRC